MNLEGVRYGRKRLGTIGIFDRQSSVISDGNWRTILNGGSGKTLNPAGACSVWIGALVTPGLTGLACGSAVDRFGDAGFAALSASSAVVSGGVRGRVSPAICSPKIPQIIWLARPLVFRHRNSNLRSCLRFPAGYSTLR